MNILSLLLNDPDKAFNDLYRSNPKFREFAEKNKGKTSDQIARDYGLDVNKIDNLMKGVFNGKL